MDGLVWDGDRERQRQRRAQYPVPSRGEDVTSACLRLTNPRTGVYSQGRTVEVACWTGDDGCPIWSGIHHFPALAGMPLYWRTRCSQAGKADGSQNCDSAAFCLRTAKAWVPFVVIRTSRGGEIVTKISRRAGIAGGVGGALGVVIGVSLGFGALGIGLTAGLACLAMCFILGLVGL